MCRSIFKRLKAMKQEEICRRCGQQQCGYIIRGLQDKCPTIQDLTEGWEQGYEDAVEKACEWLSEQMGEIKFIEDFKKHMTES